MRNRIEPGCFFGAETCVSLRTVLVCVCVRARVYGMYATGPGGHAKRCAGSLVQVHSRVRRVFYALDNERCGALRSRWCLHTQVVLVWPAARTLSLPP